MTTYDYTKYPVSIGSLRLEIEAEYGITTPLDHITFKGPDNLFVTFSGSLTGEETSLLDAVISGHMGIHSPEPANLPTADFGEGYLILTDGAGRTVWTDGFLTTISGVDPTEDYHLTTRGSVRADIDDSMFYSFRFAGTYSDEYVQHTQSTWATVGSMIFMGQNVFTIESFRVIAWLGSDKLTGYVRVYDFTNNNEIAQITISGSGPGALDKYMYTTNDLSNLPDDAAIFEFQIRVEGTGAKNIRMSYASLQ